MTPSSSARPEQEDGEHTTKTPLSEEKSASKKRRNVVFAHPVVYEQYVPALADIPKDVRDDMYWGSEDYANIRDNQRRLIEVVMRQVRQYPEGTTPPPIPGESRRGLGVICEPGTNSGRAARVRSARRAVVEAYRDGYSPESISKLATELSQWATKNAYEVGMKDHEAAKEYTHNLWFDLDSFARLERSRSQVSSPTTLGRSFESLDPRGQANRRVARAVRRNSSEEGDQPGDAFAPADDASESSSAPSESVAATSTKAPGDLPKSGKPGIEDGLGLASMIRNDSLNNLADLTRKQNPDGPSSAADAKTTTSSSPSTSPQDPSLGTAGSQQRKGQPKKLSVAAY